MKISKASLEALWALTPEQKYELNCGEIRDDGVTAEVALLLGTSPEKAIERALAAAELYRAGRVKYIVPSGGVRWEYEGENPSEAELMARVLQENGVPREAIFLENDARTTKENMLCGAIVIHRALSLTKIDHVIIVTSHDHMKRSIGLAKSLLPRTLTVSAYPAFPTISREEYLADCENVKRLDNSLRLMKELVEQGFMDDFDVPFL